MKNKANAKIWNCLRIYFWSSVALSGDRALIVDRGSDEKGVANGAVYIFHYVNGVWK